MIFWLQIKFERSFGIVPFSQWKKCDWDFPDFELMDFSDQANSTQSYQNEQEPQSGNCKNKKI